MVVVKIRRGRRVRYVHHPELFLNKNKNKGETIFFKKRTTMYGRKRKNIYFPAQSEMFHLGAYRIWGDLECVCVWGGLFSPPLCSKSRPWVFSPPPPPDGSALQYSCSPLFLRRFQCPAAAQQTEFLVDPWLRFCPLPPPFRAPFLKREEHYSRL